MDVAHFLCDDFNPVICQRILKREYTLLIARDNFGTEDNNIAFAEFNAAMFAMCNARERSTRLTLAACAEVKHVRRWHGLGFILGQERPCFL